jgi:chromosome segregation and condensation protein ScpB
MQLLQTLVPLVEEGSKTLLNYGVLGVLAVILIAVVVYLERIRKAKEKETDERISKLEAKLELKEKEHDSFINNAYAESLQVNRKCVDLLQEVKDLLRQRILQ